MTIALLEPGRSTSTPQSTPSGEVNFIIVTRSFVWWSADRFRNQRLSPGEAGIGLVPELYFRFPESPAEEYRLFSHGAGKVDQAKPGVLELNAEVDQLASKRL